MLILKFINNLNRVRYPSGLRDLSAKQGFVGSNPTLTSKNTDVAQLIEHFSPKEGVGSLNLSIRAKG